MSLEGDREFKIRSHEKGEILSLPYTISGTAFYHLARLKVDLGMSSDDILLNAIDLSEEIYTKVKEGYDLFTAFDFTKAKTRINLIRGQEPWRSRVKPDSKPETIIVTAPKGTHKRINFTASLHELTGDQMLSDFIDLFAFLEYESARVDQDKRHREIVLIKQDSPAIPIILPYNLPVTFEKIEDYLRRARERGNE